MKAEHYLALFVGVVFAAVVYWFVNRELDRTFGAPQV